MQITANNNGNKRSPSPLAAMAGVGAGRKGPVSMAVLVCFAFIAGALYGRGSSASVGQQQRDAALRSAASAAVSPQSQYSTSRSPPPVPCKTMTSPTSPMQFIKSNATGTTSSANAEAEKEEKGCCDDGWQTIQVFYGDADHFQSSVAGRQWFSQAGQDELVSKLLRGKRHGYFVDLASNDATTDSNTFALERDHGWDGLCIEPNPQYWHKLSHYRPRCRVVAAVVGATDSRAEQILFRYASRGGHGGISAPGFDNAGWLWSSFSQTAFTVPLLEILQRNDAPSDIDYLSLDVEGAESFVLLNFPFDKYRVKIITVERPKDDIRAYLEAQGFQYVKQIARFGEVLFVHESAKSELDMAVVA